MSKCARCNNSAGFLVSKEGKLWHAGCWRAMDNDRRVIHGKLRELYDQRRCTTDRYEQEELDHSIAVLMMELVR